MRARCVIVCFYVSLCFLTVAARKLTNDELHRLPKLFHLDDYERCLAQKDGVYCLGTFELTPARQPHRIYELMKEHTDEPLKYNRTLLRRGYCVSERCPLERNATLRFERCVARFAARHALTARLHTAHYCVTQRQRNAASTMPTNDAQRIYLYAIYAIILLNVVGTWYDVNAGPNTKKNSLLLAWSLPSNWDRFTKINDSGILAALAPLQSIRLVIQMIIMYAHTALLHFMVYVANPESLEALPHENLGTLIRNGTSLVQVYILISCFLTGYNLLSAMEKSDVTFGMICKWILKRLVRILPVYLLVLGFTVTWWERVDDGPLWRPIVGTETKICQRKFWYQIFFVSNLFDAAEPCLLQSWAIAVDMQLYLFSLFLTILLVKLRVRAARILGWCFAASGALNVFLSYAGNWDPMVKMLTAENLRAVFRHSPSFSNVHMSPWTNMPACFLGLFMAHYYFEQTKKKASVKDTKIDNAKEKNELGLGKLNGRVNGVDASNVLIKQLEGKSNGHAKNVGNEYVNNEIGASNGYITKGAGETNAYIDKRVNKIDQNTEEGVIESNGHINKEFDTDNESPKNEVTHNETDKNLGGGHNLVAKTNGIKYFSSLEENNLRHRHVASDCNGLTNTEREAYTINRVKEATDQGVCENNGFTSNNCRNNGFDKNVFLESNEHTDNTSLSDGCENSELRNRKNHTYTSGETNGHAKNGVGGRSENVQTNIEHKKDRPKKRPLFFMKNAHYMALTSLVLWVMLGTRIELTESRALIALFVGMERVMFSLTFAVIFIHLFTIDDATRRVLAWRGWHALGRLTYSITMLHWCVNVTIAAGRAAVIPTSSFYISMDWLATFFYSTLLALPVSLLVELPMQKFLDILMAKV